MKFEKQKDLPSFFIAPRVTYELFELDVGNYVTKLILWSWRRCSYYSVELVGAETIMMFWTTYLVSPFFVLVNLKLDENPFSL